MIKASKVLFFKTDCSVLRTPTIRPRIRNPWGPCPTTCSCRVVSKVIVPTASKLAW